MNICEITQKNIMAYANSVTYLLGEKRILLLVINYLPLSILTLGTSVLYFLGCSVLRGMFSSEGVSSVLWRMFSTEGGLQF